MYYNNNNRLFVFVTLLFTIIVVTTTTTTSAQSSSSSSSSPWVIVEAFNEAQCDLESSSMGGIVFKSGVCFNGQEVSCDDNNIVTIQIYNDTECQTIQNTTQYTSGACNALQPLARGFYNTYTCSDTLPSVPARSMSYATYDTCNIGPSSLTSYRWVPTYKCMTISRLVLPTPPTSSGSASASSGSGSSGSVLHQNIEKINSMDFLDKYLDFLDFINFNHNQILQEEEREEEYDFANSGSSIELLGTVSTGLTGGGFNTGTGNGYSTGSGSGGSSAINSVFFATLACNQTYVKLSIYNDGILVPVVSSGGGVSGAATGTGEGGSILSTGQFSSGDPNGSNMNIPTSGSTSGSGGSGSPRNGCSIHYMTSQNLQISQPKCMNGQIITATCNPPYHS
ncbi:hypothetical protein DFA_10301 [Cavenderia fasciculata]|uniref:SUEL-type lectin domain-containing protein n=1 Tax=Cavenderia fasciculata TaxID=261658 RepID=F4Q9U3_CACFS|nr:uncharacterized protein DFA_10301 [Cavenderia fasciculata]EGG15462.1 hypothetical protein DFA_10301 [Cavenderia fasciculata]|eukprot:XP_004354204.1 hypothetical protein DFA_10301 [Cavenderia fasciculata]